MGVIRLDELQGRDKTQPNNVRTKQVLVTGKAGPQRLDEIQGGQAIDVPADRADLVPVRSDENPIGITPQQKAFFKGQGKIGFWEGLGRSEGLNDLGNLVTGSGIVDLIDTLGVSGGQVVDADKKFSIVNVFNTKAAVERFQENKYEDGEAEGLFGQPLKAEEQKKRDVGTINGFLLKIEEERIRGTTTGGKIGSGVGELPLFMLEFLATGGVATTVKKTVGLAVKEGIKETFKKKLIRGSAALGVEAAVRTALLPHRTGKTFGKRRIFDSLELTQKGFKLRTESSETPFTSFAKALGDTYIEMFSEGSGAGITAGFKIVGGKLVAPVVRMGQKFVPRKFMPAAVVTGLEKMFKILKPGIDPAKGLWTKAGFNGFAGELGEERFGDFLRAITGVEDFGTGSSSGILDRMAASWPNYEEMLVEMGVLAVPVGANISTTQFIKMLQARKKEEGVKEPAELKDVTDEQARKILGDLVPEAKEGEVKPTEVKVEPTKEVKPTAKPKVEKKPEKKAKPKISKERDLIIEGRVDQLVSESNEITSKINTLEKERAQLVADGKSTTGIDNRIEKLDEKFDAVDSQIGTLRADPGSVEGIKPGSKILTTPARVLATIKAKGVEGAKFAVVEAKRVQDKLITEIRRFETDPKVQAQLINRARRVTNQSQLDKARSSFIEAARKSEEIGAKRREVTVFEKLGKSIKPSKKGKKPVGKFTPEFQKKFDKIVEVSKLDPEQVGNRITANLGKLSTAEGKDRVELLLENSLLQGVGNIKGLSSVALAAFNTTFKKEIAAGKDLARAKLEKKQARLEQLTAESKAVIGEIDPADTKDSLFTKFKKRFTTLGRSISGWADIMDMLSIHDKSKAFESDLSKHTVVTNIEQLEKKISLESSQELVNIGKEAFNFNTDRQFNRQLSRDSVKKDFGVFEDASGTIVRLRLTKSEIRKMWMEFQDPTIKEVLESEKGGYLLETVNIRGFTQEMQDATFSTLSKEDRKFARAQFGLYSKMYDKINAQYREDNGIDLPFNELYSPIRRQLSQQRTTDTFLDEQGFRRTIDPSFIKSRVRNFESIRIQSDVDAMTSHLSEMGHYIAWSSKLKDLNAIFGNAGVRNAVTNKFGQGPLKLIDEFIEDFKNRGFNRSKHIEGSLNKLRINFATSVLALKPAILLKQLTSIPAYAEFIPTTAFVKESLGFFANPIENWKTLNRVSPLFATRSEHMNRELKDLADSVEFANFKKVQSVKNWLLFLTRWGDKSAIAVGGWAVYNHTLKTTGSQKKAVEAFEAATAATQQSPDISQQSALQRGGGLAKLFTMFTSAQNQYFRRELSAWRNVLADPKAFVKGEGRISRQDFAKKIAIYHFILPMLFQWMSDFGEIDEDEQLRAATLGSLNGLFILGDVLDSMVRMTLNRDADIDLPTFLNNSGNTPVFSIVDDLLRATQKLSVDDITLEEFLDGIKDLSEGVVGPLSGAPVKRIFDSYEGINDIIEDDEIAKGVLKLMGWSPYTVNKKLGESEPNFGFDF